MTKLHHVKQFYFKSYMFQVGFLRKRLGKGTRRFSWSPSNAPKGFSANIGFFALDIYKHSLVTIALLKMAQDEAGG